MHVLATCHERQTNIIEEMLTARSKNEARELNYCKNSLELLKPMNAAGYFEIDRATLTTMLSVRQVIYISRK